MEQTEVVRENAATTEETQTLDSTPLRRVLIIGGGVAGLAAARELRGVFRVTVVDTKEYFEFTSSIMRAYAKPSHWDAITFLYKDVLERTFGVGFIWGEVTRLDGEAKCAHIKAMFAKDEDVICFDYCIIAGGCNFNPLKKNGESCWFPTVHQKSIEESESHRHLDERFLDGRRRRILEENHDLVRLNGRQGSVLVVGAGFTGVQWACELQENFPQLVITISDFLPRCLLPLPADAATYCEKYMRSKGIRTVYERKYNQQPGFWEQVGLSNGADKTYITSGVKPSNYFMPPSTLSDKGPGGGGWIMTNPHLQVMKKAGNLYQELGEGCIFAVGDCSLGKPVEDAVSSSQQLPKTGYTAETQAIQAATNIAVLDRKQHGGNVYLCCLPLPGVCGRQDLTSMSWPWGSGIFAISLGLNDGCVVVGGNYENNKHAGKMLISGQLAAAQKELIETTKVAQCRGDHLLSSLFWYLIHHCPINCVGCCIKFPIPSASTASAASKFPIPSWSTASAAGTALNALT